MGSFNLEERTFEFAVAVRRFVKTLTNDLTNYEDSKQVIRSSGSIGANYIEANEKLGAKDFLHRLRIARKEAKELDIGSELLKKSITSMIRRRLILLSMNVNN